MFYRHYKIFVLYSLLFFNYLPVFSQTEYIVTVNSTTGIPTKIDSIPGVRYLLSNSAFNQSTKEYTVIGTYQPGQSPSYLYTINATTGTVISKPLLTAANTIMFTVFTINRSIICINYSEWGMLSCNNQQNNGWLFSY